MSAVEKDLNQMGFEMVSGEWHFTGDTSEYDLVSFFTTLSITEQNACMHMSITRLLDGDFSVSIKLWPPRFSMVAENVSRRFGANLIGFKRHAWTRIIHQKGV